MARADDCKQQVLNVVTGACDSSDEAVRTLLEKIAVEVLETAVTSDRTLVSQGLDSLGAMTLLELLHKHGYDADYEYLLSDATLDSLIGSLRKKTSEGPKLSSHKIGDTPVALTGAQVIWAELEKQGWGSWANISLCLSMPTSLMPAAHLASIVQSVCDANDAMRMILVEPNLSGGSTRQQTVPNFQLPIQMREAPALERDAMRMIEDFEGQKISPFEPSTRALILTSAHADGRQWLCITMHHIFSDRISMQSIARQIKDMIAKREVRFVESPPVGYGDYIQWHKEGFDDAQNIESTQELAKLLAGADVSPNRDTPQLADLNKFDLGELPSVLNLRPSESDQLETLALRLETTLPLLMHATFSVLVARLTDDSLTKSGNADMLLCHVVSNRERHASLKDVVGCLDTSVPVAVGLADDETLKSLCSRSRLAFTDSFRYASNLPRGGWISGDLGEDSENKWASLFETVPHINIVRSPQGVAIGDDNNGIREHPVRRAQKTRWGLLLRVTLPPAANKNTDSRNDKLTDRFGIGISAFAEDRQLANLAQYCFVALLRNLLSSPLDQVGDLRILEAVNLVIDRARFASAQVRRAAALVEREPAATPFIYEKLVERQQRWYEHDERFELRRDENNRFIGTAANPFPFTQLDKLKERRFLEGLNAPLPKLIHIIPKDELQHRLEKLGPSLPESFVIKPVGAGHSFGVTIVRDGIDLTRNGVPFDLNAVAAELSEMAERGFCVHEGNIFRFNFSSFLIEELVVDERGFPTPTDYKVFMVGKEFLWLQLHFKADGHTWVAFVDADFNLLPQPAWDPLTCWRTHNALVCTEQAMVEARKPKCLFAILEQSKRLANQMEVFVRLDWYADNAHGPLIGEITTFPHMLQPRSFYTSWANNTVKAVWQDPDGAALYRSESNGKNNGHDLIAHTEARISCAKSLEDFLPQSSRAPWATQHNVSCGALRDYVSTFDLAPWGVAAGDRVGLLASNGIQFGALLLATMNRYVAVPIGAAQPRSFIAAQLQESSVNTIIVIAQTDEAQKAQEIARDLSGLVVIELTKNNFSALASLPRQTETDGRYADTPKRSPDDDVLILRTSGSTGEPKTVSFTLAKLMRSGAAIGQSLVLSPADLGISMLPLHHIGGIACNLIAPLIAGTPMLFCTAFDPKTFFEALVGRQGASWCYLVPAMWEMVLEYAQEHPELSHTKTWPRLRAIRSAGSEMPHSLATSLADLFGQHVAVLPTYGMTEAMPIAAPPFSYQLNRPGSVGRVLPTVSVEIVDPTEGGNLPVVSDGTVGEVTVKGPTVFDGYENNTSSAHDFTERGYFRTGDLGSMAADGSGWLFINGRIKEAINRGGETIAPLEVEAVLQDYPGWKEAGVDVRLMVFARAHEELGEDIALAVAPPSDKINLSHIKDWANKYLPPAMIPQTLVLMSDLPRSESGKLQRARFATKFNSLVSPATLGNQQTYKLNGDGESLNLISASNAAQVKHSDNENNTNRTLDSVLEVIRDFAGKGIEITPDTRLDDVGVNSLAAVELGARLNAQFQCKLPTWAISDYPTPNAIFSQIASMETDALRSGVIVEPPLLPAATQQSRETPLRMLFLHGEASDAELMKLSLQATHWVSHLEGRIEFLFLDAPHVCEPKPEFHATAMAADLYSKKQYRSWGGKNADSLRTSISSVIDALDQFGDIDAIGGMCDGGSVAALVASQRNDIKLYLNISSSPVSSLPGAAGGSSWTINCPTIHFISHQDELNSVPELLEITGHCQTAVLLQHDRGHAVPPLDDTLKNELFLALDRFKKAPNAPTKIGSENPASQQSQTVGVQNKHSRNVLSQHRDKVKVAMAQALGHADFKLVDDFFDVGGDSISAMSLTVSLEKMYGRIIPFESLFLEGASVEAIAHRIESQGRDFDEPSILPLNRSSSSTTFYTLPTLNGFVSDYLALSQSMSESAKVFGIRINSLHATSWAVPITVSSVVDEAVEIISRHHEQNKDGNGINLIGFSAAGSIAFQIAEKLSECGYIIDCLVLIDSPAIDSKYHWPVLLQKLHFYQKKLISLVRKKFNLRERKKIAHMKLRAELARWSPATIQVDRPILFIAENSTVDEKHIEIWRGALGDNLEIVRINGHHTGFRNREIADEISHAIFGK